MIETLNFIGCGKMGSAIINGILKNNKNNFEINVYDENINSQQNLASNLSKVHWLDDSIFTKTGIFIVCTKPNTVTKVVAKVKKENLIISIAAGICLETIDKARTNQGASIRVMPNTPFLVNRGVSALCGNSLVAQSHKDLALKLFSVGGSTFWLEEESKIDIVTGLSGSGPAFVFLMIHALEDAAVKLGLDRAIARNMAIETATGSSMLAAQAFKQSNRSSQDLINDVTSPGGTTIEGILTLKENGFESAIHKAVIGAARKATALGT